MKKTGLLEQLRLAQRTWGGSIGTKRTLLHSPRCCKDCQTKFTPQSSLKVCSTSSGMRRSGTSSGSSLRRICASCQWLFGSSSPLWVSATRQSKELVQRPSGLSLSRLSSVWLCSAINCALRATRLKPSTTSSTISEVCGTWLTSLACSLHWSLCLQVFPRTLFYR